MSGSGDVVIGVGLACLDQLLLWEDMGAPVREARIVGRDAQGGGMAATAMVTVSRLGSDAELWCAVGDDWVGERILAELQDEGVDTTQAARLEGGESLLVTVCVDQPTGERHFMYSTGRTHPGAPVGDLERLGRAGCLLVDHGLPTSEVRAARCARELGVPVVTDTEGLGERNRDVFAHVDYAILSQPCARSLGAGDDWREAGRRMQDMGPGCVIVTLGDQGAAFLDGDDFGSVPAFPIDVVDTTGAGDVFHGAFCCGLLRGYELRDNLAFASAVAALKCQRLGGRAGIPSFDEVITFLGERGVALPGTNV
ncbi:PfkB family carbohydrate kinase [Candidatus Latescibacterota bacterium]